MILIKSVSHFTGYGNRGTTRNFEASIGSSHNNISIIHQMHGHCPIFSSARVYVVHRRLSVSFDTTLFRGTENAR